MKAFECRHLVKKYWDFQLGPLDLDLEPGAVLGYIGPNGAGKTTTMHCLMGLVKAEGGEMRIFGRRNALNDTAWKLDVGYVGETHVFYESWTSARNLEFTSKFYPNWSDDKVADLVRRFHLPLKKKARELSNGNRVKLSLVAALAHSPRLLLLDEPTSGLDPVVRAEVLDELFGVLESGERAIFYSTHILSDISRLADELVFLREGKIIQRSTKEDLTQMWRKISFRLDGKLPSLEGSIRHEREGDTHSIISYDFKSTLDQLQTLGAEEIEESRLSIEEISVEILKGEDHVANH